MGYKAIIAGSSGLIGSKLIDILLSSAEYSEVVVLVRKRLSLSNSKLTQIITNFDRLKDYKELINGHAIFCCLGSTRKKTPDLSEYRKIDHNYPLALAAMGNTNGVEQFHLVSAIGANDSSSNFYTKIKGETERDLKETGIPSVSIYQPSFLTGARTEKRPVEKVGTVLVKLIDPLLFGSWSKYKSIPAETVAMAMYKRSLITDKGIFTYPSDKIKQLL